MGCNVKLAASLAREINGAVEVRRLLRHRSPFILGATHFHRRAASAIAAPMTLTGFQALSRPAGVADKHIFRFFSALWRNHWWRPLSMAKL